MNNEQAHEIKAPAHHAECPITAHASCVREIARDEIDQAVMRACAKFALALFVAAVVYSLGNERGAVSA